MADAFVDVRVLGAAGATFATGLCGRRRARHGRALLLGVPIAVIAFRLSSALSAQALAARLLSCASERGAWPWALSGAKKVWMCVDLYLPYGAWLGLGTAHVHSSHCPLGVLACFLCAHAHTQNPVSG